ncbi:MAG: ester cyclase [Pseudomonadota bacterium]
MSVHDANKARLAPFRAAFAAGVPEGMYHALLELFEPEARIRLGFPLGEAAGPDAFWGWIYGPLLAAMPDFERRDFIVMAGAARGGTGDWVGLGGNIVGTFVSPWLGIPPTGRPIHMRYHEYYRFEDGRVVEMEGLWDIPQVMHQAHVWPMAPQLGVEWMCPAPAEGGVIDAPHDAEQGAAAVNVVWDMLHELQEGDAAMPERGLGGRWHPNALWYGSTGIGSARGHRGIRDVVLRGFRTGLSDNIRALDEGVFFGDRNFVAFTGWPSAEATHSGDGFLGLAPTGRRFIRRSLDFWRIEDGLIRENWVMVDLLDIYRQLGVDVLARMSAIATRAA